MCKLCAYEKSVSKFWRHFGKLTNIFADVEIKIDFKITYKHAEHAVIKEIFQSSKIFLKYAFWNIISAIFYCIHIYIYVYIICKRKEILYNLFLNI